MRFILFNSLLSKAEIFHFLIVSSSLNLNYDLFPFFIYYYVTEKEKTKN